MATEPVKTIARFSDDPTYDSLLSLLLDLACEWRTTKSDETAKRYQTILKSLLEMGWSGNLDMEALLPNRLMPSEYLERNKLKTT